MTSNTRQEYKKICDMSWVKEQEEGLPSNR